ncbi:hypothetical protein MKY85_20640 [Paenibacillus sp. FSL R5-0749]|uniref:hypothetical protein n=1 Tax=Paenibacillus sp. FSL R5-0749 TaxID=2921657 RepID=UPI00315A12A9
MLIQTGRFNTIFPRIDNLRKRAFDIEENLQAYYSAMNVIALPDNAPEMLTRLSASSINGHSQIEISLSNAQVNVQFDEAFNTDPEKCLNYLKKRADLLNDTMSPYLVDGALFSGLTIEGIVPIDSELAVDVIKDKFLNYRSNTEPFDIEYKLAYVLEDRYYVNLVFRNIRFFEGIGMNPQEMVSIVEKSNLLGVSIDINDRYLFNRDNAYRTEADTLDAIYNIMERIVKDKLPKMITEGVIEL